MVVVVGWFPFSQFVGHATPNLMNSHILFLIRRCVWYSLPSMHPQLHPWCIYSMTSVFFLILCLVRNWFSFPCLNFQWIWKCANFQTGARYLMRISKREMRAPHYWLHFDMWRCRMIGSSEIVEGNAENFVVIRGEESISIDYSVDKKNSLRARYVYGLIFLITNLLAWLIRDYGQKVLAELRCKSCFVRCTNVWLWDYF